MTPAEGHQLGVSLGVVTTGDRTSITKRTNQFGAQCVQPASQARWWAGKLRIVTEIELSYDRESYCLRLDELDLAFDLHRINRKFACHAAELCLHLAPVNKHRGPGSECRRRHSHVKCAKREHQD